MRIKYILFIFCFNFFTSISNAQDDFKTWDEEKIDSPAVKKSNTDTNISTIESISKKQDPELCSDSCPQNKQNLLWLIGVLGMTVLAGFLVRFKFTRNLRVFYLVASIAILGFYRGSCPCPISGFQETFLVFNTSGFHFGRLLWFLGLLPITYFFGKVWCGWVCQLGALQEFIFSDRFNFFATENAQKVMRYIRIVVMLILLIQLLITKDIIWNKYDPFKTAFNLMSSSLLSWVLLGILLLSSVLMYRPFCKTICPVGLVLGWVSKLPGASILKMNTGCVNCKTCNHTCKINAITYTDKIALLDNQECIGCGECIDSCKHDAVYFSQLKKNITK